MHYRCIWATEKLNLTVLTGLACGAGFGIGAGLQTIEVSDLAIELIRYPGELFIRALKLIVLPLVGREKIVSECFWCGNVVCVCACVVCVWVCVACVWCAWCGVCFENERISKKFNILKPQKL